MRVSLILLCSIHNNENLWQWRGNFAWFRWAADIQLRPRHFRQWGKDWNTGECWQLRIRALSLREAFVGCRRWGFGVRVRDNRNRIPALAAAAERKLTPKILSLNMQTVENLMQYNVLWSPMYSSWLQWCCTLRSMPSCKHSSRDYPNIVPSIAKQVNSKIYARFRAPTSTRTLSSVYSVSTKPPRPRPVWCTWQMTYILAQLGPTRPTSIITDV